MSEREHARPPGDLPARRDATPRPRELPLNVVSGQHRPDHGRLLSPDTTVVLFPTG